MNDGVRFICTGCRAGEDFEDETMRLWPSGEYYGGALGPMGADHAEPLIDFTSKETVFRVNPAAQLLSESAWSRPKSGWAMM